MNIVISIDRAREICATITHIRKRLRARDDGKPTTKMLWIEERYQLSRAEGTLEAAIELAERDGGAP